MDQRRQCRIRVLVPLAAALVGAASLAGGVGIGLSDAAAAPPIRQAAPPNVPDPTAAGPHQVDSATYDLGSEAVKIPGLPRKVELAGVVHHPRDLAGHRYPLVVFLHGAHPTCADTTEPRYVWPCPKGSKPLPNYRGYDYVAGNLASHGYVVVSISANGINAQEGNAADAGDGARAALLDKHLALWTEWATRGGGPFGNRFAGAVDLDRIGTMGHSRGGEGVVIEHARNAARPKPYKIKAVLALAPSDFSRRVIRGTPFAVILPYCDGDIYNLDGVHYFDDSRYGAPGGAPDTGAKHTVTVMGANHNFFNTVWSASSKLPGSLDDADVRTRYPASRCNPGQPGRLSETQQRKVGIAYVAGFFRRYLGDDQQLTPIWTGATRTPPQLAPAKVLMTYHAPDTARARRDVNRLAAPTDLTRNALGGAVTLRGLDHPRLCTASEDGTKTCLTSPGAYARSEPHSGTNPLAIFKAQWARAGATMANELPAGVRDLSAYRSVRFRVALDWTDRRNTAGQRQQMAVTLTDGKGASRTVPVAPYTDALDYPQVSRNLDQDDNRVPRFLLNQVRMPLDAFAGVDLHDVVRISLVFTTASGSLGLDDLQLTSS